MPDDAVVFAPFRFDPRTRRLFKYERPVRLNPQPAKLLALLVQGAGDVVSRETIQSEIWGRDTFVDFDQGINACVRQIRAALGDDAENPRYVETVPREGYRFIAELTPGVPIAEPEPVKRSRAGIIAATIVAATLGLATVIALQLGSEGKAPGVSVGVVQTSRVNSPSGEKAHPDLSPDGDWVVYAALASGGWDIYLQDVNGAKAINLTADFQGVDDQPTFSPDGSRIAFYSERDGGGIFVMGRTGESVRRLTPESPQEVLGAFGFNPTWSPDGRLVAFSTGAETSASSRGIDYGELWVVDVEDGESRRLRESQAIQPQWSPHGHRIAFWSKTGESDIQNPHENGDVWSIPASGGTAVRVTDHPSHDWNPVWSADGDYIYFLSERGGSPNVWRVPADERSGEILGPSEAVTRGEATARNHLSVASRDGRLAYVVSSVFRNLQRVGFDPETEVISGEPEWLTEGSAWRRWPIPSPDGKWLSYVQREGEETWLYVSRVDGRMPVRLAPGDLANWSPDSERLAFASTRGGSREIWAIDRDGTDLEQLTNVPSEALSSPVWSPDGSRLAGLNITSHNAFLFEPGGGWEADPSLVLPSANEHGDHLVVRSWSPNGRFLLGGWPFDHSGKKGIGVYDLVEGSYATVIEFHSRSSRWLSDSDRFIFLSAGPDIGAEVTFEPTKLFLGRRTERSYHEILDVAPDVILPGIGISSDDRMIYFSRDHRESDIWLLELDTGQRGTTSR